MLVAVLLGACFAPAASAALNSKKGLVSDPSVTTLCRYDIPGVGTEYYYQMDIRTLDTITVKAVNGSGQQVKVPKGGRAEWKWEAISYASGSVRLTPSADGSTCTVKAVKGGQDVMISVTMYDRNGKQTFSDSAFIEARYNAAEWIAVYLTLGLYGVSPKGVAYYLKDNGLPVLVADAMGYYFGLLMPWDMFD